MGSTGLRAWLLCGTLDIVYACATTILRSGKPVKEGVLTVLQSVAAGPFGDRVKDMGWTGGLIGLGVHYAIMAVMVAAFLTIVWQIRWVRQNAILAGVLYGVLLYGIMYCVVLALRYPAAFPQRDAVKIAIGLFPHIFFVGIPLAWLAKRGRA